MKISLEKTRENIARNYSGDASSDNITEVVYRIVVDGQQIGDARAYQGSYNININGNGVSDISAAEDAIKALLNINDSYIDSETSTEE
jgi:hypothetical protein